jgi:hypothetical protein
VNVFRHEVEELVERDAAVAVLIDLANHFLSKGQGFEFGQ